jgi:hypothetical protein
MLGYIYETAGGNGHANDNSERTANDGFRLKRRSIRRVRAARQASFCRQA